MVTHMQALLSDSHSLTDSASLAYGPPLSSLLPPFRENTCSVCLLAIGEALQEATPLKTVTTCYIYQEATPLKTVTTCYIYNYVQVSLAGKSVVEAESPHQPPASDEAHESLAWYISGKRTRRPYLVRLVTSSFTALGTFP